jgi:hypothetical protein
MHFALQITKPSSADRRWMKYDSCLSCTALTTLRTLKFIHLPLTTANRVVYIPITDNIRCVHGFVIHFVLTAGSRVVFNPTNNVIPFCYWP